MDQFRVPSFENSAVLRNLGHTSILFSMVLQLQLWQNKTRRALLLTTLLVISLAVLVCTVPLDGALTFGFTLDFLLTVPLLYLLLIRRTKVPAITALPLSLLMLMLATWLLPEAQQQYLELYKQFVLPVLELLVLGIIIAKVRRAGIAFKAAGQQSDMYYRLQQASLEVIPFPKAAANALATEAAMFYYAVKAFKKPASGPGFSYHRETALGAIVGALMLLIVVETIAVHLLLMQWSALAANLLTFGSLYSFVYMLALIGAARHRPHTFTKEGLLVRFGLQETLVRYHEISSLEKLRGDVPDTKQLAKLGMLGNFNLLLQVKEPQVLTRLYGFKSNYTAVVFWVDDVPAFIDAYEEAIKSS